LPIIKFLKKLNCLKIMKQLYIMICMIFLSAGAMTAQIGLEDVIIETYYVANATDIAQDGGMVFTPLPTGAKTYRVYVDMLAGWELQAVYAATNLGTGEVDTMVIRSTQPFWNHTDKGKTYGYQIANAQLPLNVVGLDSWFSTNRTSVANQAVLEVSPTEDTNGAATTHPHTPVNVLSHNDPAAGLALTVEDGSIALASTVVWTPTPGLEPLLDVMFADVNDPSTELVVSDGALGIVGSPLTGANATSNRVCIGQFTTAGIFSGQINVQLRRISDNLVEQYVAHTPAGGQFSHPALVWGPNALPTIAISAPTEGQMFVAPTTVNFDATASDSDGSITQVQYYLNGVAYGAAIPGPGPAFNTTFPTGLGGGAYQLIAIATDNDGGTAADTVNFVVNGNTPPAVILTAPNAAITGTTVNISATATDADGIASVQFFFNNVAIGAPIPAPGPYATSFTATPAGTYTGVNGIRAVATDLVGVTGSDAENITITDNVAPTVTITVPADGAFVPQGIVAINANAGDTDGTVAQVEFFVNGISIGVDNTLPSPFTFNWNAVFNAPFGANVITAVVTDNLGLTGNSNVVNVNIVDPAGSPYAVLSVTQACNPATVCMPISAVGTISDVIGFDMVLTWDDTEIYPTGNVVKSGDFMNTNYFETDNSIDFVNNKMLISVFLDTDAPVGQVFAGTGDIVCVEFAKRVGFSPVDTSDVTVTNMQESYANGVALKNPVPPGTFITYKDTTFSSQVVFWEDQSPIGNSTPVSIQGNIAFNCDLTSAAAPASLAGPVVNTDGTGHFTYNFSTYPKFSIGKDIAGTTDVQEVINGFDALLTRRLIIDDASFTPNVFQAIAMDVNRDGVISAGDVSQINQRAVLFIPEFKQQWNYNAAGAPLPSYSASKDWQFIDNSTVALNPAYQISSSFPNDNAVGYSKYRVPKVPFCITAPVTNFATCPIISEEIYTGILYGDVNGNYKNSVDVLIRTSDAVNVGVGQAVYNDSYVDVPVSFTSSEDIYSIDLNLDFNGNKLVYESLVSSDMQAVAYYNENDGKLRITSNSLDVIPAGKVVFMVRFSNLTGGNINTADFGTTVGYLNGDKVNVNLKAAGSTTPEGSNVFFNVYPNPANDYLYIGIEKDVKAEIVDMNGRVVVSNISVSANSAKRIDVSGLTSGLYTIRVISDNYTSSKRVFIGN
jgi:hypothetical protein